MFAFHLDERLKNNIYILIRLGMPLGDIKWEHILLTQENHPESIGQIDNSTRKPPRKDCPLIKLHRAI